MDHMRIYNIFHPSISIHHFISHERNLYSMSHDVHLGFVIQKKTPSKMDTRM